MRLLEVEGFNCGQQGKGAKRGKENLQLQVEFDNAI